MAGERGDQLRKLFPGKLKKRRQRSGPAAAPALQHREGRQDLRRRRRGKIEFHFQRDSVAPGRIGKVGRKTDPEHESRQKVFRKAKLASIIAGNAHISGGDFE
ncbi:MAG: hypothetical protein LBK99_06560 [Opitutaceae bacterium]|nr:hypothetical protein [Opitutaceae bacterium]